MKIITNNLKSIKVLSLILLISVSFVQDSQAFVWFGAEERSLGDQYAYGDTCVHVIEVKTYFLGILVKTEIEQRPFRCLPQNPS
jgi:hypothetical protein